MNKQKIQSRVSEFVANYIKANLEDIETLIDEDEPFNIKDVKLFVNEISPEEQKIFFTPITYPSKQDEAARTLATLLCKEGIDSMLALPVAIDILVGVQKALRHNDLDKAIEHWSKEFTDEEKEMLK